MLFLSAVSIAVERSLSGVPQLFIVGEIEIVVGAGIQDLATTREFDLARLLRRDDALGFVEPRTSTQPVPQTNKQ